MRIHLKFSLLSGLIAIFYSLTVFANPTDDATANPTKLQTTSTSSTPATPNDKATNSTHYYIMPVGTGPVVERAKKEAIIPPDYFSINFYKPTYLLPYYYTGAPYNTVYANNTPDDERLKHAEIKYQLSFKVPVWKNILNRTSSLYLAYTQMSYWQAYNQTAFFRESDYEPELFLANEINFHLVKDWYINFLNVGLVHQSNGYGGNLERSWNRMYLSAVSSTGNWVIGLKSWYVFHDSTMNRQNPDIAQFLGYGEMLVGYKYHRQFFSIQTHSLIESHARHATAQVTWSFPISQYIKGYVQVFSGYGQSLIEYNHRTNSAGLGVAFSDWV